LPIPLAAGAIVALVIAHYRAFKDAAEVTERVPVAVVVVVLAFLMVSTVRYRTFKDVHLSPKSLAVFGFLCLAGVAVGVATRASFALLVYVTAYVAMGLAESLLACETIERPQFEILMASEPIDKEVITHGGDNPIQGNRQ
jgi:CDP-diacylglycerol--serine O-phosphatidyltransferase